MEGDIVWNKKWTSNILESYYQTFRKYLDDFTMYSDMESHLQKFILHFQKCK